MWSYHLAFLSLLEMLLWDPLYGREAVSYQRRRRSAPFPAAKEQSMEMNRIVKGLSRMSHFLTCYFSLRRCSAVSREGMLRRDKSSA